MRGFEGRSPSGGLGRSPRDLDPTNPEHRAGGWANPRGLGLSPRAQPVQPAARAGGQTPRAGANPQEGAAF
ncbi:hypothetical protein GCM10010331_63920 [Streptomyces xanthochromogenes]|nr:hypothetical protein GCM10010331_63920 [Streptomyces xanthochromogenes]